MKVIQIFFLHPSLAEDNVDGKWLAPKYRYMTIALSSLLLKKVYGEVTLITDEEGAALLVDVLKLPFTDVEIIAEESRDKYLLSSDLAKLYALQLQTTPFLYVDLNVFIWDLIDPKILEANLFGLKSVEIDDFYLHKLSNFDRTYFSPSKPFSTASLVSTQVLGGKDLIFFSDYYKKAREITEQNTDHRNYTDIMDYLFYCLVRRNNVQYKVISEFLIEDRRLKPYDIFVDSRARHKLSYIPDLLKKERNTLLHLAFVLKYRYPYYYKIVNGVFEKDQSAGKNKTLHCCTIAARILGDYEKQFIRTKKALRIFFPQVQLVLSTPEEFFSEVGAFIESMPASSSKELLKDVFGFERNKWQFSLNVKNDGELLALEQKRFTVYEDFFSRSVDEIFSFRFTLTNNVTILESQWKWGVYLDVDPLYPLRVVYNVPLDPGYFQTLCWTETETFSVREYDLEQFDMILLDSFRSARTIESALQEVQTYFENEDNLMGKLKPFAVDRVREFFYLGALQLELSELV